MNKSLDEARSNARELLKARDALWSLKDECDTKAGYFTDVCAAISALNVAITAVTLEVIKLELVQRKILEKQV